MYRPPLPCGGRNISANVGRAPQADAVKPSLVHFNNAGCSFPAPGVVDAVQAYIDAESLYGGYEASELPEMEVQLSRPYKELAALLSCEQSSIGIVNSATAAWQRIFLGLPLWQPGSRIYTSMAEYGSNYLAYLQARERHGTEVCVVRELRSGALDLGHLEELLRGRRAGACNVVSISHIPTSSGRVYDAAAVGAVVRGFPDVVYLLDACQSVGQLPVDVQSIGCHFLTGTGRKYLRAPRGSGFLYVSPRILRGADPALPAGIEPAALDVRGGTWLGAAQYSMHATARRYEEYEMSFAAKVGLGVACAYARSKGIDWMWERIQVLASELRSSLRAIPAATVHDHGELLCGIVSFSLEGWPPQAVKAALREGCGAWLQGQSGEGLHEAAAFNVSVSAAPSTRLDFERRGLSAVVRASVHAYNTAAEVQAFAAAVRVLASNPAREGEFGA